MIKYLLGAILALAIIGGAFDFKTTDSSWQLIINKKEHNFNNQLFPPKTQCPNQFKKCPCLDYE